MFHYGCDGIIGYMMQLAPPDKEKRSSVDWERIEPEWRAGIKSKKQLAAEFNVSRAAMDKHFAKLGVERDLTGKIQAQADALVARAAVTPMVTPEQKAATEKDIIDANAGTQAAIRLSHRSDIQRARGLTMRLLGELEAQTITPKMFSDIEMALKLVKQGDDAPEARTRLSEGLQRALSLAGRTTTMKALAESLQKLVTLEREAFGLDAKNSADDNPLGALLRQLGSTAAPVVAVDPDHVEE